MSRRTRWFSRKRMEGELAEEIRAHVAEKVEELVASGMGRVEAERAARREFGNLTAVEEEAREVWRWTAMEHFLWDIRHGLRMLRRNPSFTIVGLLTIAIGIGANAAVFSVLNSVLLKPLNYPESERLVYLHQAALGAAGLADFESGLLLSPSMYVTYSDHNRTFQSMGVWTQDSASVTGTGAPEQVRVIDLSDGVLEALAVPPAAGRWLSAEDQLPTGPQRVMLSYGYWQQRFGGDTGVVGRSLVVDSRPREIVGVMPRGFRLLDSDFDILVPTAFDRSKLISAGFGFRGLARLKPGVTIAQANADITRMLPIWMDSWHNAPGSDSHVYESWKITPLLTPLKREVVGNVSELLWVVMGTIGLVMLIACANVANLMLVRAEVRQQELAVRAALGADRARIVRGLLTESVLLGLLGGVAGVALAYQGVKLLVAVGPANLPRLSELSVDGRTLGFALVLSILSGLLFGWIPALKYAARRRSPDLRDMGRTSSPGRERLHARNMLVTGQVAMALVLLVCAGLMIRTFAAMRKIDPGFTDGQHIQMMRVSIPEQLVTEPERVTRTQDEIVAKLRALPGVQSAAFVSQMPMEGFESGWDEIMAEDRPYTDKGIPPMRLYKYLSPGFLQTVGTRLIAGRDITWTDVYGQRPVVLLSENLAREFWGTPEAAIGKRVREFVNWNEVIGVVQDVKENGVQEATPKIVYWPPLMANMLGPGPVGAIRDVTFTIRTERAGSKEFLGEVQQAVWSVNTNLAVASVRTMEDVYRKSLARSSFTLTMLGIAGAMALALGMIGVYGVISYTVSRRQREIGIRVALGAQRGDVLRMVLRQGGAMVLAGMGIGIAASLAASRVMSGLLFGVTAHDPATFAVVIVVLAAVALAACYIPARRATRVDPVVALRYE